MKIFDSLLHKRWTGRGLDLRTNSILILKSAKFSHPVNLKKGRHTIRIVGKKRTGSGKVFVKIISGEEEIFLNEEIEFTTSTSTEKILHFDLGRNIGPGRIEFSRERQIFGSIEMTRVIIDVEVDLADQPLPDPKLHRGEYLKKFTSIDSPSEFKINRSKKIAIIIPYKIFGGAEIYIGNIVNQINQSNGEHTFTFLYLQSNFLQNYVTVPGVTHRQVNNLDSLVGYLKSVPFDFIIYYNKSDIYYQLTELKAKGFIRAELIEIYHSDFAWSGSLSKVKTRIHVDRLITVAPSLGKNFENLPDRRRAVVPVGIDLERFRFRNRESSKQKLGIKTSKPIIGTVARLSKEKNLEYNVELARLMPDYHFLIIGDNGGERGHLEEMIDSYHLTNIELLGHKTNTHEYYNAFDAFILASPMEGTPISILEAMASGALVFSNMVGAIPDIIIPNQTGIVISGVPAKDAPIVAENIGNESIPIAAREYVQRTHDLQKTANSFLKAMMSMGSSFESVESVPDKMILPGEYV